MSTLIGCQYCYEGETRNDKTDTGTINIKTGAIRLTFHCIEGTFDIPSFVLTLSSTEKIPMVLAVYLDFELVVGWPQ